MRAVFLRDKIPTWGRLIVWGFRESAVKVIERRMGYVTKSLHYRFAETSKITLTY